MSTPYSQHPLPAATRRCAVLAASLFRNDTRAHGADPSTPDQTRTDLIFFTIFGVLVSLLGVWVLYLQSALARAGIY